MGPRPVLKPCAVCGTRLTLNRLTYCSKACSNTSRAIPEAERFWNSVDKSGACWLWTAAIGHGGYGSFARGDRSQITAHRMSWILTHGRNPPDQVLHRCDVPACVRPDHLWSGSHRDNHADKANKGRTPYGENNSQHKLTAEQVEAIRSRYAAGGISQQALADHYGLSQPSVSALLRRETWARVP